MRLAKYLGNLGYGSRKQIEADLKRGRITRADGSALGPKDSAAHDDLRIDGEPLDPAPGMVVMLHKPAGYTCSRKDYGPLVYDLLPPRWLARKPALSSIGRLDADTTGLLLFTDDGQLLHRLISPRSETAKVYEATLARPLEGHEAAAFAAGTLMLKGEEKPLKNAVLEQTSERSARVTLTEGRYHQVRRMFAALGNHVDALHRPSFAGLTLGDLPEGEWRLLAPNELAEQRSTVS